MKTIVDYARKVKEQHALNKNLAPIEADASASSKAYAIGQHFILNGELYKAKTAIALGDALVLDTNYEAAGSIEAQIETLDAENQTLTNEVDTIVNVLGAKNLLKNTASSTTVNGITFTVNSDGSVTVNGTATGNAYIRTANITDRTCVLNKGKYTFNGCPAGGSLSGYYAYATDDTTSFNDIGNGVDFTISSDNTPLAVIIYVRNGTTVSNLTFYPMIRPASIEDDTYVPYAMTNRELMERTAISSGTATAGSHVGNTPVYTQFGKMVIVNMLLNINGAVANDEALLTNLPQCSSSGGRNAVIGDASGNTARVRITANSNSIIAEGAITNTGWYSGQLIYFTD